MLIIKNFRFESSELKKNYIYKLKIVIYVRFRVQQRLKQKDPFNDTVRNNVKHMVNI